MTSEQTFENVRDFWEWVCCQAYNEKSAKLVQASDHTRKLLRELEIESETRAKIEAESHRLRGELASMRGRCVDVRVAVCVIFDSRPSVFLISRLFCLRNRGRQKKMISS